MTIKLSAIVAGTMILGSIFATPNASAQEVYSGVSARFADFASITWINDPYNDTERCESALERSKSRIQDSCPQCIVRYDCYFYIASLHPTYRRILE